VKNRLGASLTALAFLSFPRVDLACAQAIERHQPLLEAERRAPIIEPDAVPMDEDDTPIGPELKSLAILSGDQSVKTTVVDGVDVSSVARLVAAKAAIEADLKPFIGRPISRRLIAQVEEVIARRYRRLGFPFVSLSTPEQKISDGALQVRVLEFSIGKVLTSNLPAGSIQSVTNQIGLKPGDAIDARRLGKDLAWLNRYPFRSIQAVFTPSKTPGGADLILSAQSSKPWRLYLGYDNSGSPSSTTDRYFAGGAVGDVFGRDSVVYLQLTSSRDALAGAEHPNYASEAISYSVPVSTDVQIEANFDHIEANPRSGDFLFRQKANEGALAIRFSAPFEFSASSQSDIRLGLSAKQQKNVTLFGGETVSSLSAKEYGLSYVFVAGQSDSDSYYSATF
jgi:hemolysin activation/secretion protein